MLFRRAGKFEKQRLDKNRSDIGAEHPWKNNPDLHANPQGSCHGSIRERAKKVTAAERGSEFAQGLSRDGRERLVFRSLTLGLAFAAQRQ